MTTMATVVIRSHLKFERTYRKRYRRATTTTGETSVALIQRTTRHLTTVVDEPREAKYSKKLTQSYLQSQISSVVKTQEGFHLIAMRIQIDLGRKFKSVPWNHLHEKQVVLILLTTTA